ncbi:MAG: hypothetical protein ACJAZN_003956 [Planctomycetota bacterium]
MALRRDCAGNSTAGCSSRRQGRYGRWRELDCNSVDRCVRRDRGRVRRDRALLPQRGPRGWRENGAFRPWAQGPRRSRRVEQDRRLKPIDKARPGLRRDAPRRQRQGRASADETSAGSGSRRDIVAATCGADGSYDWPEDRGPDSVAESILIEVAEDDVYSVARWSGTPEEWLALPGPLELLRLPHGTFAGHVVDLSGRPIKGVKVSGERAGGAAAGPALSQKDGYFAIPALGSKGSILAELNGWVMCSSESLSELREANATDPEVVMARAGTLNVSLGDSENAPGFAVATVSASESLRRSSILHAMAFEIEAGPDHVAVIEGLPIGQRLLVRTGFERVYTHMLGGELLLEPENDDEKLPAGAVPIVIPESGTLGVQLTRSTHWTIKGELVDAHGAAVPNSRIRLLAHWRTELGGRALIGRTQTHSEGHFQLRWLATGEVKPYMLLAAPADGSVTRQVLTPTKIKSGEPLRIVLAEAATVKGRILVPDASAGQTRIFATTVAPLAQGQESSEFALEQTISRVKSDGTFSMAVNPGVRYRLLVKHPGFASVSVVLVADHQGPLEITLDRRSSTSVNLEMDFGDVDRSRVRARTVSA